MTHISATRAQPNHAELTFYWAELEKPQIYLFIFLYLCGRSQKHKVPTNGTYNWFPGQIFGATCTIFQAGAVPGAPGARRGPPGPKIGQNPEPDLSFYPP